MKKINLLKSLSVATMVLFTIMSMDAFGQKERLQIEDKYKWDLTPIFPSDDAWRLAKEALIGKLPTIDAYKGKLTQSPAQMLACMDFLTGLRKDASRLYAYASLNSDVDKRDMKYSGMEKELQQIFSDFSARSAYVNPEILTMSWDQIENFIKQEPKLAVYRQSLLELFHSKTHTLSEPEEKILALSSQVENVPYSVFSTFSNAEMPSPEVTLSDGEKVSLNSAGYEKYRVSQNRNDRELVFKAFWENYKKFEATYGEVLYGNVKSHVFEAKARNYQSSLEAAIDPNSIPVDVYKSLIDNVNKNLPAFYRYLSIKKRMLGVDTLKYIDLYAPVVKDVSLKYTYEQAQDMVLKAVAPLGTDYVTTIKKAFDDRWIDVYPTPGKRSGAYSNDAAYDAHPYMLLNYNGNYEDVSTLAHELGHTMQSYFSIKNQPYVNSDYPIFVAEVASTFNEALLFDYVMKTLKDDDVKLTLLMNWLDRFKGTLFRQTQFAEFELKIHEAVENGTPLTGEYLSKLYGDIVRKYYGQDKGICYVEPYIDMEWAFIPHFYYNFYVYQYSTSFTASLSLSESVINKEPGAVDKYIKFLSAGGSDFPIALLKNAGVDMTTSVPFDNTIKAMNMVMDEIEKILDKKQGKK
jgi:oligoendopeptidase F